MKIKIENQAQLESIVYTCLDKYDSCVIELRDNNVGGSLYFTSTVLSETEVLLSMSVSGTDKSVGNVIKKNNGRAKMQWVKDKCDFINFDMADITLYMSENKNENNGTEVVERELNFIEAYRKIHGETLKRPPIKIETISEAMLLFDRFLENIKCTKIIYSFSIRMPDINHTFMIDVIADKLYIYGKTLMSITIARPDSKKVLLRSPFDTILEYHPKYKKSMQELEIVIYDNLIESFLRCTHCSKEEVNVYVYSNSELI